MVHALEEIRRVLAPGGILIDIRPLADRWPVEVGSTGTFQQTGRVTDLPVQVDGDVAANQTMKEAEARGWFEREQEALFPFLYSWDTPSEMEEFIAEDWADFVQLDEPAKMATRAAWASAEAEARVQVRVQILITRWKVKKTR
jgi:hypothetical protein